MNIREISVARLKEYENNPRNNDLAVEKVKYSIERFGFLFPVVVDINNTIVAGHTRVRACRELGIHTIPCVIADELTEEQINLFRLVDNKTSEYSDWDFEKLKAELACVDLTLERNQILLDRFELSAEVFDIEPEQAVIKIPAFNFMGEDEPRERKTTVDTIHKENVEDSIFASNETDELDSVSIEKPSEIFHEAPKATSDTHDTVSDISSNSEKNEADSFTENAHVETAEIANNVSSVTQEESTEKAKPLRQPQFNQFRFGDVAFFISKIELERLNEKYAEYVDSDAMLKCSFVDYLLNGVASCD